MTAVAAVVNAVRTDLVDTGRTVDHATVRDVARRACPLLAEGELDDVVSTVLAEVRGLGPLEPLLADPAVTDVLVNGDGPVWVERGGSLARTGIVLSAPDAMKLLERVVAPLGLRVDPSTPFVDARLPDGSRLHASIPPIAVDGPCLAIRRFAARPMPLAEMCDAPVAGALRRAVVDRATVVVSGATGAGKTTLLNALAGEIDDGDRIVTIEDTAELRLPKRHVVRLEARPANADGVGEVSIRQLVRNALRMRPDRLVVGEVRGAEAFDMLQAVNTGHRGSLTTCHANSARDALTRLEAMVLLAGVGLAATAIRRQLSRAIDVVVHVERAANGRRRVAEVLWLRDEVSL